MPGVTLSDAVPLHQLGVTPSLRTAWQTEPGLGYDPHTLSQEIHLYTAHLCDTALWLCDDLFTFMRAVCFCSMWHISRRSERFTILHQVLDTSTNCEIILEREVKKDFTRVMEISVAWLLLCLKKKNQK